MKYTAFVFYVRYTYLALALIVWQYFDCVSTRETLLTGICLSFHANQGYYLNLNCVTDICN